MEKRKTALHRTNEDLYSDFINLAYLSESGVLLRGLPEERAVTKFGYMIAIHIPNMVTITPEASTIEPKNSDLLMLIFDIATMYVAILIAAAIKMR